MNAYFAHAFFVIILAFAWLTTPASAQVANVKIVTDASPDYYDVDSLLHSITSKWTSPEEKCWALFYWNHIARRQTHPMVVHGLAVTDPIRQFNDYGYTMCSTIAGINCTIWDAMGLKAKYWDITQHTVSEVFFEGRWHMYDNSMSALYTLCDGKTLAGVEDIGKPGACAASCGVVEPGHIARYHCRHATSPTGFLSGADCARSLTDEAHCFNPNALKYRSYFYDWDRGHRYILNLKEGESYTRYYHALGSEAKYYVPNHGKDPDADHQGRSRYHLRGNGVWTFKPRLTAAELVRAVHALSNLQAIERAGLETVSPNEPGEVVFKIDGANVITGMTIKAAVANAASGATGISVSTTNGLVWRDVWKQDAESATQVEINLVGEVNGAYEVLVKFRLAAQPGGPPAGLRDINIETTTMLNSKTQPRLALGRNAVYVGTGSPTGSIVFWPDLQGRNYEPYVIEEKNIATQKEHPGYMGVMHAEKEQEDAFVVFRLDAPRPITRLIYGGRLYNRAANSHIDFLHSFDGGRTWTRCYSLTDTKPPWDVIHYETVDDVPPGAQSVLVKYLLSSPEAGPAACSLYAVRIEANYELADPAFHPLEITYRWKELHNDRTLVERSHSELVTRVPHTYTINVGGDDHPIVDSLGVNLQGTVENVKYGYSDEKDVGGEKFVGRWVTYGKNLAQGKPYAVSIPSGDNWGAGDPEGKTLTDGVAGPPYAGGVAFSYGLCWSREQKPEITVDLGSPQQCAAFRIHLTGYPWWDSLKGECQDEIEVLTSTDGQGYTSHGFIDANLRWKDLPANHMWPDEESETGPVLTLVPEQPVEVRYVRYKITARRFTCVSEVMVLDSIRSEPFDLKIALPGT
ncbi:MAG: discoidin domain-containing protein [Pirellulaceae bacterium]